MPSGELQLRNEFTISAISSIHFFEYKSDFIFKSEYHQCFLLLYVESGSCEILSGMNKKPVSLTGGQIYIQAPEKYYSFRASGNSCPTLFACGFSCDSPKMSLLTDRALCCGQPEQRLLSLLAEEGQASFFPDVNANSGYTLERKYNQPFGGEQLIRLYLEMLLIDLVRQTVASEPATAPEPVPDSLSQPDAILLRQITDYYSAHIAEHITVETICKEFSIGRSHLQRIFRRETGLGAIEYFCQMRISAAKKMIRENEKNLTEIARELGYTSIHYFSKQFKKITGMAPSKYLNTMRTVTSDPVYHQIELERKDFQFDSSSR